MKSPLRRLLKSDPSWPDAFERHITRLRPLISAQNISFHHIGSTAVSDLIAKPVIDILLVVPNLPNLVSESKRFEEQGYDVRGTYGIEGRHYLKFPNTHLNCAANIHAFEMGAPEIDRHLRFRDRLRLNSELRDEYSALKRELCRGSDTIPPHYQSGKTSFIEKVLADSVEEIRLK